MKNSNESPKNENIKPESLPKILTNIYGILAVVFVLIPEWIAELTLSIHKDQYSDEIIKTNDLWKKNTYIYISSLSIKELRRYAYKLKINGYASENQNALKARILKRLNRLDTQKGWKRIKKGLSL